MNTTLNGEDAQKSLFFLSASLKDVMSLHCSNESAKTFFLIYFCQHSLVGAELNQICCFAPSSPRLPWCAGTPGAGGASAVISGFLPVGPPIVA